MKSISASASRTILASYTLAVALIAIDIFISQDGLTANDGFSFYGGFARTVVPYSFALLCVAYGTYNVSYRLRNKKQDRKLADVFMLMTLCILGLVLTPHTVLNAVHTFFGSLLFSVQLLLMIYLARQNKNIWTVSTVIAMFAFGIFALVYLYPDKGFELEAQAGFQISFALGLAHYFRMQKL